MPASVLPASSSASTATPSGPAHSSRLDVAADLLALLHDTATEPRIDTQLEALTLAVAADLPVLLWGEPGIGKTAALEQLAVALDLPLTTVIASVHEPSDFSGLPVVGDDPAVQGVPMAPPDWAVRLARAGRGLLFLDELSTAPPPSRPLCSASCWSGGSAPCDYPPESGSWRPPIHGPPRPTAGS
ncbi:hypothetical protein ACFQX6_53910 [Streptosporangium lutulentum]